MNLQRIKSMTAGYPPQFWTLFGGTLVGMLGATMAWPFMMIYISEKVDLPLTTLTFLLTIQSVAGLVSTLVSGSLVDRFGRKKVVVVGFLLYALSYLFFIYANTYFEFALLLAFSGLVGPSYQIGIDSMIVDLLPEEKRLDGFSLIRMAYNLGVALGPAIGGFIASGSYPAAFISATVGLGLSGLFALFFTRETIPLKTVPEAEAPKPKAGGYRFIFKDLSFRWFLISFTLTHVCSMILWYLLGMYVKHNFGITESQYGFIPTTNAILVITLQLVVTGVTRRFNPILMQALGALLYAISVGGVALGEGFWAFWLCMVVLTFGEMILVPTATTFVANLAPEDMRGRYMGLYNLCWWVSGGIGPLMGGILSDNLGPRSAWVGGGLIGLVSVVSFLSMAWWLSKKAQVKVDWVEP